MSIQQIPASEIYLEIEKEHREYAKTANYVVAIPSYQVDALQKNALPFLSAHAVDALKIFIFCANETAYRQCLEMPKNSFRYAVPAPPFSAAIHNFISGFFKEGTHVVIIAENFNNASYSTKIDINIDRFLDGAFKIARENNLSLWGIRDNRAMLWEISRKIQCIRSKFFGFIAQEKNTVTVNTHIFANECGDLSGKTSNNYIEDEERSIKYYEREKAILCFHFMKFKDQTACEQSEERKICVEHLKLNYHQYLIIDHKNPMKFRLDDRTKHKRNYRTEKDHLELVASIASNKTEVLDLLKRKGMVEATTEPPSKKRKITLIDSATLQIQEPATLPFIAEDSVYAYGLSLLQKFAEESVLTTISTVSRVEMVEERSSAPVKTIFLRRHIAKAIEIGATPTDKNYNVIITGNTALQSNTHTVMTGNVDLIDSDTRQYLARFRPQMIDKKYFNATREIAANLTRKFKPRKQNGKRVKRVEIQKSADATLDAPMITTNMYGYREDVLTSAAGLTSKSLCRKEQLKMFLPVIEQVDLCFKTLLPTQHKQQWEYIHRSNYFLPNKRALDMCKDGVYFSPKDFQAQQPAYLYSPDVDHYEEHIGTSFSSFNLNGDAPTVYHKDRDNFKEGFGNLIVFEKSAYAGCYTIIAEYCDEEDNIYAFDVREGDFLGMDVQKTHANSPLYKIDASAKHARISCVNYVKNDLACCPRTRLYFEDECSGFTSSLADIKIRQANLQSHDFQETTNNHLKWSKNYFLTVEIEHTEEILANEPLNTIAERFFNDMMLMYTGHVQAASTLFKCIGKTCSRESENTLTLTFTLYTRRKCETSLRSSGIYPFELAFRNNLGQQRVAQFYISQLYLNDK